MLTILDKEVKVRGNALNVKIVNKLQGILQGCLQQLLANIVLKLPENYNVNRTYYSSVF